MLEFKLNWFQQVITTILWVEKFILDLNNETVVNFYVNHVIERFNDSVPTNYDPKLVYKIIFSYNESDLAGFSSFSYKESRNQNTLNNKIVVGNLNDNLALPYNTAYLGWGNIIPSSDSEYVLKDIDFSDKISEIKVKHSGNVSHNSTTLYIYFKDTSKESVVVKDILQQSGLVKRVISTDNNIGFIFYFNPKTENTTFQVDMNPLPKVYTKDDKGNNILSLRQNIIHKALNYDDRIKKAAEKNRDFDIPNFKAITLDIETFLDNTKTRLEGQDHNIMCVCFFDGLNSKSFYINDYNSSFDLLDDCFNNLIKLDYNKYNIYIHNGSKFDLNFLVNYLLERKDIRLEPIYKDNKFLSLDILYTVVVNGKHKDCKLSIKDSILLLLSSLDKLGKTFNVEVQKDVFPYSFPDSNNLDYSGSVPSYNYFDSKKVSMTVYEEYVSRFVDIGWNLKNETINYCLKDCVSLYQIMNKFKLLIDSKFRVNMQTCPTITSLAFKIFKANYYNSFNTPIPEFPRDIFEDLNTAFYGGHVDMYIPQGPNSSYNEIIEKYNSLEDKSSENVKKVFDTIKHYDINSLYPSSMKKFMYPTELICKFIGDITENPEFSSLYESKIGIYKVKITAPDIKNPIMPIKIKGRCIFGTGEWIGWYFSAEIKNAEKFGYKIQILGGYVFESKMIFDKYITALSQIKESSDSKSAMYLISKILMNSLFGRLGMNPFLGESYFITKECYEEKITKKSINPDEIVDCKEFGKHYLITNPNKERFGLQGNVAISLAITSYSRVVMSEVKNIPDVKIYYSDTDSIFTDVYLPSKLVDPKKLGFWKLENEYIHCILLGPKTYGCLDLSGVLKSFIESVQSYHDAV